MCHDAPRFPGSVRALAVLPHSSRYHVKRVAVVYPEEVNGVKPFPVTGCASEYCQRG